MTVKEKLIQAVLDLDKNEAFCAEIVVDQEAVEEERDFDRIATLSTRLVMQALDEEERAAGCEPWRR